MAMSSKEYHDKYEYRRVPDHGAPGWTQEWQDDWDGLGVGGKEDIKQKVPFRQERGAKEQGAMKQWWDKYQEGPNINIWKGLSEATGYKPGAIRKHMMDLYGDLTKRPDFAKEYGLRAEDLGRNVSEAFAARGMLDSSGMASAMGSGMSNLMMERAMMEENAWINRQGIAGGMRQEGRDFSDFLNNQYLENLDLGKEAIKYLRDDRWQEDEFNLQRYAINPNPNDPITGLEGGAMFANTVASLYSSFSGGGGYNFDWQGGDDGGGSNNWWEDYGQTEDPLRSVL